MSKPRGQSVVIVGANGKVIDSTNKLPVDAEIAFSGDIQLGAVEMKDGVTNDRARVKDGNTMTSGDEALAVVDANMRGVIDALKTVLSSTEVLKTAIYDDTGAQVTAFGSPSTIAEYKSPSDFTATYTSSTTITLSSLPLTIADSSQIVYIRKIPSSGDAEVYVNGSGGVTMTVSSNVLTIAGVTAPFASGDSYEIGINAQKKAYDSSTQSNKASLLNPVYSRYTDVETLIAAAQELDATPTDLGAEIDMSGYNELGVWLTVDIGTSTDVTLRIIHKHTSAGAEEYREIYLGSPASNITTVNLNDYQVGADSDQLIKINIPVSMTSPYIQLQVSDAADGDGQIDACYITKAYAA